MASFLVPRSLEGVVYLIASMDMDAETTYFSSNNYLLVRVPPREELYELRRDVMRAVYWCE